MKTPKGLEGIMYCGQILPGEKTESEIRSEKYREEHTVQDIFDPTTREFIGAVVRNKKGEIVEYLR